MGRCLTRKEQNYKVFWQRYVEFGHWDQTARGGETVEPPAPGHLGGATQPAGSRPRAPSTAPAIDCTPVPAQPAVVEPASAASPSPAATPAGDASATPATCATTETRRTGDQQRQWRRPPQEPHRRQAGARLGDWSLAPLALLRIAHRCSAGDRPQQQRRERCPDSSPSSRGVLLPGPDSATPARAQAGPGPAAAAMTAPRLSCQSAIYIYTSLMSSLTLGVAACRPGRDLVLS